MVKTDAFTRILKENNELKEQNLKLKAELRWANNLLSMQNCFKKGEKPKDEHFSVSELPFGE